MPKLVRHAVVDGPHEDKVQCEICKKMYGRYEQAVECEAQHVRDHLDRVIATLDRQERRNHEP